MVDTPSLSIIHIYITYSKRLIPIAQKERYTQTEAHGELTDGLQLIDLVHTYMLKEVAPEGLCNFRSLEAVACFTIISLSSFVYTPKIGTIRFNNLS